jgi:hypothetical protein
MTKLEAYKVAIVKRANYQATGCCDNECAGCSWFDDCQGLVEDTEGALLLELASQ